MLLTITRASIKRVVITSSTVSVNAPPSTPTVFSEVDWNEVAPANVEKLGREADNLEKYSASKTLAEKGKFTSLSLKNDTP